MRTAREILQMSLPRPFGEIHCLNGPDYYERRVELSKEKDKSFRKMWLLLVGFFGAFGIGVIWVILTDQNKQNNLGLTAIAGLVAVGCLIFFFMERDDVKTYNKSIVRAKELLVDISFDIQKNLARELFQFNTFLYQFAKIFQAQKLGLSSYSEEDFEHYHVLLLHNRNLLQEAAQYWVFYADTRNAEALSRIEDLLKQLKPYPKQDQDRR